jgi:hypothetical protein
MRSRFAGSDPNSGQPRQLHDQTHVEVLSGRFCFGRPTRTETGASTMRISASGTDDSRRPHSPEIVPALVNRSRELIVELCLVVGPVEPDLSALDVAPSQ